MNPTIFVGFDGFIDSILHTVAKRISPQKFTPIKRITDFATIAKNASSKNASVECVLHLQDLGGNAPILARALFSLSNNVILAGCCGYPTLHPLFSSLPKEKFTLHSIGNPGFTDALEFSDGKLFLGKMGELSSLSLSTVLERAPHLISSIHKSSCIATVNWTMMPLVEEFWNFFLQNPSLLSHKPILFVDLANPKKRTSSSLLKAMSILKKLNTLTPVILGLNRAESEYVANLHHLKVKKNLLLFAQTLRENLKIEGVLIHAKTEAAVSFKNDEAFSPVPWTKTPFRTTGAGDTFNAGFLSALLGKQNGSNSLKIAIAASGTFVRTGIPPTQNTIKKFLQM